MNSTEALFEQVREFQEFLDASKNSIILFRHMLYRSDINNYFSSTTDKLEESTGMSFVQLNNALKDLTERNYIEVRHSDGLSIIVRIKQLDEK